MKVSVPSSYVRQDSAKTLAIDNGDGPTGPAPDPELQPELEQRTPLPLLSSDWWQSFLHGNSDALIASEDAQVALDLIADKLGKAAGTLDINGSIRSRELRKKVYAEFGADLALHTMQGLWLEASAKGEEPKAPTGAEMPETVARFFAPEDPIPPWRRESDEDRLEREARASFGGWAGG
jgi:hypothetical protein